MSFWYKRKLEELADTHEQQATDIQRGSHHVAPAGPEQLAQDKKAIAWHRKQAAQLRAEAENVKY